MKQYINKDALVAEIERRIKETESMQPKFDQFWAGQISAFKGILKILDALEVKVVDLDEEIKKAQRKYKTIEEYEGYPCTMYANNIECIAKHFFELGLKTQHSSIDIPNIDDILEEDGIDPNSKIAKIFKEGYYMALERLIAQKGEEI